MATIHPSIVDLRLLTPGSYRERDVLLALESSLSDDYHCYHSVNWAAVKPNRQHHGEFDIVVLTPAAHLMVLEVKGSLPKLDDLRLQLSNQRDAIRGRLKQEALNEVRVEHLLILTDNLLPPGAEGTIGVPIEKIIDSSALETLPHRIREFTTTSPMRSRRRERHWERWFRGRSGAFVWAFVAQRVETGEPLGPEPMRPAVPTMPQKRSVRVAQPAP